MSGILIFLLLYPSVVRERCTYEPGSPSKRHALGPGDSGPFSDSSSTVAR
jgi:hypothetical protein